VCICCLVSFLKNSHNLSIFLCFFFASGPDLIFLCAT
jgi:hypothetical protein